VYVQNVGITLNHLLCALVVAVVAYIFREVRRRRAAIKPRRPELTIREAWSLFDGNRSAGPDSRLVQLQVAGDARRKAEQVTRDVERLSIKSDNPRLSIRQAILGNATMAFQLAAVAEHDEQARQALIQGYMPGMDALLQQTVAACHLSWFVLRVYARWKFDDAVEDDWFHNYIHVARPYIREKVRLAREHILEMDPGAGRFVEIYDSLLSELRGKMVQVRPKQRFVRPDLPWN
jgi:hypothetical protein